MRGSNLICHPEDWIRNNFNILSKGSDLILTHDRRLRRRARQEGFATMRLFNLFIEAKMIGLIPAVKPLLDEMRSKGVLIRKGLYREALREAGEL